MENERENPSEFETEDKGDGISSDLIRGHINTIILRTLEGGDKYGYEIIDEIETKSQGQYSIKQPTLYSALKRLEAQGYVTSYWGGSSGGGRRRYFHLTEAGKSFYLRNQEEWAYSRSVIDHLISPVEPEAEPAAAATPAAEPIAIDPVQPMGSETEAIEAVEPETESVEPEIEPIEAETEPVETETEPVEPEIEPIEAETEPVETETEPVEAESEAREEAAPPFADETQSAEAESEATEVAKADEPEPAWEEVEASEAEESVPYEASEQALYDEAIAAEEPTEEPTEEPEPEESYRSAIVHTEFLEEDNPYEDATAGQIVDPNGYKDIIGKLYDNAIDTAKVPASDGTAPPLPKAQPQQLSGNIEFFNILEQAEYDGIRVRTSGVYKPKEVVLTTDAPTAFFDKGKTLFRSGLATAGILLLEFFLLLALRTPLSLQPNYYFTVLVLSILTAGVFFIFYKLGYGKNAQKTKGSTYIAIAFIIFATALLFIAAFAVGNSALSEQLNLVKYIVIPSVLAANIVFFSLFYHLFKRKAK